MEIYTKLWEACLSLSEGNEDEATEYYLVALENQEREV